MRRWPLPLQPRFIMYTIVSRGLFWFAPFEPIPHGEPRLMP